MKAQRKTQPMTLQRIYARCTLSGECRLWNGGVSRYGYPYIHDQEKHARALAAGSGGSSRSGRIVVWKIKHGEEPSGQIMMTCGSKLCLNLKHMRVVTQAERCRESAARGSFNSVRHQVARLLNARKNAKLSPADVLRIRVELGHYGLRQRGKTAAIRAMAAELGVNVSLIYGVLRGSSWKTSAAVNSSVWSMAA